VMTTGLLTRTILSTTGKPKARTSTRSETAMRLMLGLGRAFIAACLIALGVQHFVYHGYLKGLELLPEWLPLHTAWAYLAGVGLIVAGVCFLSGQKARVAALLLGSAMLLLAIVFHTPLLLQIGGDVGERTRLFETLALCGGVWALGGALPADRGESPALTQLVERLAVAGRLLLAVSMIVFGIAHFQIGAFVASLIPAWIPWHLFWTYFTGIGFFAAGVSFGIGRYMRPLGLLLALMFFLWVVVLHAPRIAHALGNGNEWNSGFVALSMAGCALVLVSVGDRDRT
jgi:uncharacterized membrane protein YphA (DoxX/SURF4 family)